MSGFAVELMMVYLANARPGFNREPSLEVAWSDVVSLFFSFMPTAKALADTVASQGHVWTPEGISDLDDMLIEIAEAGDETFSVSCSPAGIIELERRCSWAIIAAKLEDDFGRPLELPSPRFASDAIRGNALFLYVLAGPARDYRVEGCLR